MNERIGKLVEQAEEWVCKNYPDAMDDNDEFHAQTMEKFAELIVRQCADIAKHHVSNISTYSDAEFVDEQIKEHFGVEE
jgi:hypothetical protein